MSTNDQEICREMLVNTFSKIKLHLYLFSYYSNYIQNFVILIHLCVWQGHTFTRFIKDLARGDKNHDTGPNWQTGCSAFVRILQTIVHVVKFAKPRWELGWLEYYWRRHRYEFIKKYSMTSPGSGRSDIIRGDMNFCDKKHFINKGMATHLGETAECSSQ